MPSLLAYLDVTAPAVEVEVQVLDLAVFAKFVVYGLLVGLLVHVGHDNNPALDGTHGGRFAVGLHVVDFCLGGHRRDGLVDVHFYVGHGHGKVLGCKRWKTGGVDGRWRLKLGALSLAIEEGKAEVELSFYL